MSNDKKPVFQPQAQALKAKVSQSTQPTASYGTRPVRDANGSVTPVVTTASYGTNIIRNSEGKTLTRLGAK